MYDLSRDYSRYFGPAGTRPDHGFGPEFEPKKEGCDLMSHTQPHPVTVDLFSKVKGLAKFPMPCQNRTPTPIFAPGIPSGSASEVGNYPTTAQLKQPAWSVRLHLATFPDGVYRIGGSSPPFLDPDSDLGTGSTYVGRVILRYG